MPATPGRPASPVVLLSLATLLCLRRGRAYETTVKPFTHAWWGRANKRTNHAINHGYNSAFRCTWRKD
jgi:hypothetical protein